MQHRHSRRISAAWHRHPYPVYHQNVVLCPITHLGGFFFIDSKDDRHFLTGSLIFLEKDKIYKLMSSNCHVGLFLSFLVLVVC